MTTVNIRPTSGTGDGTTTATATVLAKKRSFVYPILENQRLDANLEVYGDDVAVRLHPITNRFVNEDELEAKYQERFVKENLPRTFRIACIFLALYLLFIGPNIMNLFSENASIRAESVKYTLLVFPAIAPIPFLLYLSRLEFCHQYFQEIYSIIMLCWSFSFLAGGMHSLLSEWFVYVESDMKDLLRFLNIKTNDTLFDLNAEDAQCDCTWWHYSKVQGTSHEVLSYYLGDVLLPAATMNINLLRLIMVMVVTPLMKLDVLHYSCIVSCVATAYCVLTEVYYPSTGSSQLQLNKTLVILFSLAFAAVMWVRHRDFERILRHEFLHVHSVERAAVLAKEQKEIIARENEALKEKLARRSEEESNEKPAFDMESPVAKILMELQELQASQFIGKAEKGQIEMIYKALSKLDTNLFTPDLQSQMQGNVNVDRDTKNWALDVFGYRQYKRPNLRHAGGTGSNGAGSNGAGSGVGTGVGSGSGVGSGVGTGGRANHALAPFSSSHSTSTSTGSGRSRKGDESFTNSDDANPYDRGEGDDDDDDGEDVVELLVELDTQEERLIAHTAVDLQNQGWDFDVVSLFHRSEKRPLLFLGLALFEVHDVLAREMGLEKAKLVNFLSIIDDGYMNNPYHNSIHAAEVANAVNYLISSLAHGHIRRILTAHEFFASLIAAMIHDFRHPGKTNLYLIKTKHDLAIQFSDSSVLERMHLAEAFAIAKKNAWCDIFAGLKEKAYVDVRKAIIEMVLVTDLSGHLQFVGNLKTAAMSAEKKEEMAKNPMMLMNAIIKTADIGHTAKTTFLHGVWSSWIIEEFFQQGDLERKLGVSISPFMDRHSENSAKNQVGFFDFIVLPFFESVASVIYPDEFKTILANVQGNYQLWKKAVRMELTLIKEIKQQLFEPEGPRSGYDYESLASSRSMLLASTNVVKDDAGEKGEDS